MLCVEVGDVSVPFQIFSDLGYALTHRAVSTCLPTNFDGLWTSSVVRDWLLATGPYMRSEHLPKLISFATTCAAQQLVGH